MIDQISKTKPEGYPPYNIEQISKNYLRITVAVAGFSEEDLSVMTKDNQLIIKGKHHEDHRKKVYIHRGIASRQFQRSFILADAIKVVSAYLDNGLLQIDLHQVDTDVRKIAIKSKRQSVSTSTPTIDMQIYDINFQK